MPTLLRFLVVVVLLVTARVTNADEDVSVFADTVAKKLSRLAGPTANSNDASPEHAVLVDVTSDGSVVSVKDQQPVADKSALAKLHRLILMASPFPKLPSSLRSYSSIRLAIVYVVVANESPDVVRVEIKGGFKYVEF